MIVEPLNFELLFLSAHRNNSGVADYQLMFVMPEEEQGQLRNFTLSREMVYNVLRQFLYDQEYNVSHPMYIDQLSLKMSFSYQWENGGKQIGGNLVNSMYKANNKALTAKCACSMWAVRL